MPDTARPDTERPDAVRSRPPLDVGSRLSGRYRVLSSVVLDGLGRVQRAHDEVLDRPVAIVEPSRSEAPAVLAATRLATRFRHPSLLEVHDVIEEPDRGFIVTEFVDGVTLEAVIATVGPRPPAEVLSHGEQLCHALAEFHRAGAVHGGVLPSNIVRTDHGRIVLLRAGAVIETLALAAVQSSVRDGGLDDDGLGQDRRRGDRRRGADRRRAVEDDLIAEGLLPPERHDGPFTSAGDVYGVAATLYFLATGDAPPSGEDRARGRGIPPVHVQNPIYPTWFSTALNRALSLDPAERPHTATDLLESLRAEREHAVQRRRHHPDQPPPGLHAATPDPIGTDDEELAQLWPPMATQRPAVPPSRPNLLTVPLTAATAAAVVLFAVNAWRTITPAATEKASNPVLVAPATTAIPATTATPATAATRTPATRPTPTSAPARTAESAATNVSPPIVTAPVSRPSGPRWTVRVHRATTQSQASALAATLVGQGADVFVTLIAEPVPDGGQWAVDLGVSSSTDDAETLAQRVRTRTGVADAAVVCAAPAGTGCALPVSPE